MWRYEQTSEKTIWHTDIQRNRLTDKPTITNQHLESCRWCAECNNNNKKDEKETITFRCEVNFLTPLSSIISPRQDMSIFSPLTAPSLCTHVFIHHTLCLSHPSRSSGVCDYVVFYTFVPWKCIRSSQGCDTTGYNIRGFRRLLHNALVWLWCWMLRVLCLPGCVVVLGLCIWLLNESFIGDYFFALKHGE